MEYLKREWSIDGRYSLGYAHRILEQRWHRTGRPIVLVIDGLNENVSIPDFGQCMYDFLRVLCLSLSESYYDYERGTPR